MKLDRSSSVRNDDSDNEMGGEVGRKLLSEDFSDEDGTIASLSVGVKSREDAAADLRVSGFKLAACDSSGVGSDC